MIEREGYLTLSGTRATFSMKQHISLSPDGVKPPLIMSYCFAFIGSDFAFFHVESINMKFILRYTLPEILPINFSCNNPVQSILLGCKTTIDWHTFAISLPYPYQEATFL